jgi:hypothetical protein
MLGDRLAREHELLIFRSLLLHHGPPGGCCQRIRATPSVLPRFDPHAIQIRMRELIASGGPPHESTGVPPAKPGLQSRKITRARPRDPSVLRGMEIHVTSARARRVLRTDP